MLPVSQLSWDEHDDGILRLHFCGSLDKKLQGSFGVHSGFGNVDGSEDTGCILMQYTGFKDKNGKEIYEGDIVQPYQDVYSKGLSKIDSPQVVEYSPPGFLPFDLPCHGGEIYMYDTEFEVVGNIYENPELLKGK